MGVVDIAATRSPATSAARMSKQWGRCRAAVAAEAASPPDQVKVRETLWKPARKVVQAANPTVVAESHLFLSQQHCLRKPPSRRGSCAGTAVY